MGGFPSGQRGQTVNLLSTTSVVRIHHLPPKKRVQICALFCFTLKIENRSSGFESRLLATCWMHVATGVAFPQKSESTTSHQETEYRKMLCFCFGRKSCRRKPLSHFVTAPLSGEPNLASPERGGGPRQRWRGRTEGKNSALSVAARHLSQRERQVWIARKSKQIRTGFSALPLGELAFAKQMTERAARRQVRIRANLKSHVS